MKKMIFLLVLVFIISVAFVYPRKQYAISIMPTIAYNTPDIMSAYEIENNKLISRDRTGLVRQVEAQGFTGTVWEIAGEEEVNGLKVYKARSDEFWNVPEDYYFYIDARSVTLVDGKPKAREVKMPSREELLSRLIKIKNQTEEELIPYVWGGNTLQGINHRHFFGKDVDMKKLSNKDRKQFYLQGLDCTGLLYYITDGYTPRNSSWLRTFGEGVDIENKNIDEVIATVEPLDLVVHQGHVFLVLNKNYTIESRLSKGGGVVITPIRERFEEVFEKKVPLNLAADGRSKGNWFVIRRFTN